MRIRLSDRTYGRTAYVRLLIALVFVLGGAVWLGQVVRDRHRSDRIQAGPRTEAAIAKVTFVPGCRLNVCRSTRYAVRFEAQGRLFATNVVLDDWHHDHAVGTGLRIAYDRRDPARAEVAGKPPSQALPLLGALSLLGAGALLALAWGYVLARERIRARDA